MAHNNNSTQSTTAPTTDASVDDARPCISNEELSKQVAFLTSKLQEVLCLWRNGPAPSQPIGELASSLLEKYHIEILLPIKKLIHSYVWPAPGDDTGKNRLQLRHLLDEGQDLKKEFNAVFDAEYYQALLVIDLWELGMERMLASLSILYESLIEFRRRKNDNNV
ncbi:predicted protein [Sclerotinia sclerotiorum 1980 UF-70]|uniref:Uncharacterized protein n=2 Tax=Sclerotinia sclerotiorum (strain ATCC 18683 / 1980 / Ss-1) TaxID=665079 RepID=A7F6V1_SCLS1|nr:predicted protein [Sclerotinia sclerotiorum 1980 UF-70]APA08390.1 hypothetical protein sscle_03g031600 [Sclerotinia sclerotiorum 1980 UF-70]EDN98472.1 predicted protein [Sclerotinia sclerotiorum 1980 UF-70]